MQANRGSNINIIIFRLYLSQLVRVSIKNDDDAQLNCIIAMVLIWCPVTLTRQRFVGYLPPHRPQANKLQDLLLTIAQM